MKQVYTDQDQSNIEQLAESIAGAIPRGAMIELVGDVGAGKTTFTRALARGMGISSTINSPTFTIENRYEIQDGRMLLHYDFYRLGDAGIMQDELAEALSDETNIVVIEWAGIVDDILPKDRLQIQFEATGENTRKVTLLSGGENSDKLLGALV
ncbi:MAG TPA: tRNA (adenosine(37)-N6)-threonylcarbamoyltransferase complex ATPase subunit type 1 TsaE [Candidatus Saccharimonadales bacterium]